LLDVDQLFVTDHEYDLFYGRFEINGIPLFFQIDCRGNQVVQLKQVFVWNILLDDGVEAKSGNIVVGNRVFDQIGDIFRHPPVVGAVIENQGENRGELPGLGVGQEGFVQPHNVRQEPCRDSFVDRGLELQKDIDVDILAVAPQAVDEVGLSLYELFGDKGFIHGDQVVHGQAFYKVVVDKGRKQLKKDPLIREKVFVGAIVDMVSLHGVRIHISTGTFQRFLRICRDCMAEKARCADTKTKSMSGA
jgi:hypothetical protein